MAEVVGFQPAKTNQQAVDDNGNPVFVGVWGDSTTGVGVFGTSGALGGNVINIPIINNAGVVGHSVENTGGAGAGVWGESVQGQGVVGRSQTNNGVLGITFGAAPVAGVFGTSTTGGIGVVGFVGDATGVLGSSISGSGVLGSSDTYFGVWGTSRAGIALRGDSALGQGVLGYSLDGIGVHGVSTSTNGVVGHTDSPNGAGVLGESPKGGFAGFFNGDVGIAGDLLVGGTTFKGGGGFMIDHPLDPGNKFLRHSFVESPEMLNTHSGNVTTDANGDAIVALPQYTEVINQDFRYQLTVIGKFSHAIVAQEISNGQFKIKTDQPRVKVSWQVTGVRRDPWAVANRIAVEEEKGPKDKGRYLHPELWGRPSEEQIYHRFVLDAARHAPHRSEQKPSVDHSRLEEEWRKMQDLLRRMEH